MLGRFSSFILYIVNPLMKTGMLWGTFSGAYLSPVHCRFCTSAHPFYIVHRQTPVVVCHFFGYADYGLQFSILLKSI